jgi:hypothetical protein
MYAYAGGVAVAFRLAKFSLCFVTAHLAPHHGVKYSNHRDRMYRELAASLRVGHPALEMVNQFDAYVGFVSMVGLCRCVCVCVCVCARAWV